MENNLPSEIRNSMMLKGGNTDQEKIEWLIQQLAQRDKEIEGLKEAINGIIKEPYGCPMCDSGILRNKEKEHWDNCPYLIAQNLIK